MSNSLLRCKNKNIEFFKGNAWLFVFPLFFFCIATPSLAQNEDETKYRALLESSNQAGTEKNSAYRIEELKQCLSYFGNKHQYPEWYKALSNIYQIERKKGYPNIEPILDSISQNLLVTDPAFRGKFYFLTSYIYVRIGKVADALELEKKALVNFKEAKDLNGTKKSLINLSTNHARFNDHEAAIKYGNHFMDIANEADIRDQVRIMKMVRNLARYHSFNKEYSKSFDYIHRLYTQFPEQEFSLCNISIQNFISLNKIDEAKVYLEEIPKEKLKDRDYLLTYNEAWSELYEAMGDFEKSYEINLSIYNQQKDIKDKRILAKRNQELAMMLFRLDRYEESMEKCDEVLSFFCGNEVKNNNFSIPDSSQIIAEVWVKEALNLKANIFSTYFQETDEAKYIELAYDAFDKSIFTIDLLRAKYLTIEAKYKMTENTAEVFSDAVEFSVMLNNLTKNPKYFNKALFYSQKAKSYVFKESISERKGLELAKVSKELVQEYLDLMNKRFDREEDQLEIISRVDSLRKKLIMKYPDLKLYQYQESLNIDDFQKYLLDDQVVLHYFTSPSSIYCFVIDKNDYFITSNNIPADIEKTIHNYRKSISDFNYIASNSSEAEKHFIQSSTELFDLIFQPIEVKLQGKGINQLIIVPDGFLKNVVFKTLPFEKLERWNEYSKLLISKYATSFVYNSNQIKELNQPSAIYDKTFIGLDYKAELFEDSKLAFLPFVNREFEEISDVISLEDYRNEEATRNRFIDAFHSNDLVHFSGHSIMNKDTISESYIPLYPSVQGDKLSYEDVLGMQNETELLVLNACNTSNGKNVATESVFSLSNAFAISGTQSIVGTSWNTPDESSYRIIESFYNQLLSGENRAVALQKAQLEYLTNDNYSSPRIRIPPYWAQWSIHGDIGALNLKPFRLKYLLYCGLLLLFSILAIKFLRPQKKTA